MVWVQLSLEAKLPVSILPLLLTRSWLFMDVAKERRYTVMQEPVVTFYGQKRLLIKDPNGVLVDVSSPESR